MSEFQEFQKIARLSRECVVTEKIDGTNAQVYIFSAADAAFTGLNLSQVIAMRGEATSAYPASEFMVAGSRNRYITPDADNFGFAAWVRDNAERLWALGEGRHYGEWWGAGIQRRYGIDHKRWSLFNVARWVQSGDDAPGVDGAIENLSEKQSFAPRCCHVVPVLYRGAFDTSRIDCLLGNLRDIGSVAAPGFTKPEGVVIWHEAARQLFKKTLEKDEMPKGMVSHAA